MKIKNFFSSLNKTAKRKNGYRKKESGKNTTKKRNIRKGGIKKRVKSMRGGIQEDLRNFEYKLSNVEGRLSQYLRTICPNSGFCITFGRENDKIKSFFDGFSNFKYISSPVTLLTSGVSGFVNEIIFERDGYKVSTILKSSIKNSSDNLFYEAYIGMNYINPLNRFFPCFLETYGFFRNDESFWNDMKKTNLIGIRQNKDIEMNIPSVTSEEFASYFTKLDTSLEKNINITCKDAKLNCLLTQYIDEPISFLSFLEKNLGQLYFDVELLQILWQVYSVLTSLTIEFTHYDLHYENVLLYTIPDNKYMELNYYNYTGFGPNVKEIPIVKIKTRYIVKIIDYGRCYTPLTSEYYKEICNSENCDKEVTLPDNRVLPCGKSNGYNYFYDKLIKKEYYTGTRVRNISHDLRLVNFFKDPYYLSYKHENKILSLIAETLVYDNPYGTNENTSTQGVANVVSLSRILIKTLVEEDFVKRNNFNFERYEKAGTMNIYLDRSKELEYFA